MTEKKWSDYRYIMGNVHCYGIQDIRKCSTAPNPRKKSSKMRIERDPREEGKNGLLGGEGSLMGDE